MEVTSLADGQVQFRRLFCSPSGCNRTFRHFDGMVSVDAAHLKSVLQGQLLTMTTYDANKELTVLAFGVASSEDSETWSCFAIASNVFPPLRCPCQTVLKGWRASR